MADKNIDEKIIKENKKLIEKYPFIAPIDWDGNKIKDNYDFTLLDEMPPGWKKAFGIEFCEDLLEELKRCNFLDKYSVCQVKEKYGELRWYDNGHPHDSKIGNIIEKYSHISSRTCIHCGAFPVDILDNGWICPWCKDCYEKSEQETLAKGYITKIRPYENFVVSTSPFDPIIRYRRYSKDGAEEYTIDCTDTVEKILKKGGK